MQFSRKNLRTTCHRTSLIFSETIYISEAQNNTKSAQKSSSLGSLRFEKQKKKKGHAPHYLNFLPVYGA